MAQQAKRSGLALLTKSQWHLLPLLLLLVAVLGACGMMRNRGMMVPVEPRPRVTPAPTATPGGPATVSYRNDVRPILMGNCAQCHGGQMGLYVESYDTLMAGSSINKVIIPGEPQESILVQRLKGVLLPRMPLNSSPLAGDEIAVIETWIREGAPNN